MTLSADRFYRFAYLIRFSFTKLQPERVDNLCGRHDDRRMREPAHPRHAPLSGADRAHVLDSVGRALSVDPRVRFGVVFGSFARGLPFADLDVGISLDGPWGHLDLGELAARVEARIGLAGVEVEVTRLDDAAPAFRAKVARDGIVVHRRSRWEWPAFHARSIIEGNDLAASLRRTGHLGTSRS